MRYFQTIVLLMGLSLMANGQERDIFSNAELTVDFGSVRFPYLYPINNIRYNTPVFKKTNIKISTRLRSYGTWFFFSKSAYDFSPVAEYYFAKEKSKFYVSAGLGLDCRLRLTNDERSDVASSVEPIISVTLHGNHKKLYITNPTWIRMYSNGISICMLPEISYQFGKRLSVFYRYESTYMKLYKFKEHEWQQDMFVGVHFLF